MSVFNLSEVVRLRRNDQRDSKLSAKIEQIVKYSLQEVAQFESNRE